MITEMTPHLKAATTIACDVIADAPIGAVVRMLRHMEPDGCWPDDAVSIYHHAQDVAAEGIMGDGPEACAVLATVLVEAAPRERIAAIVEDAPESGAVDTVTAIDWITSGLETGALTPSQAREYARSEGGA